MDLEEETVVEAKEASVVVQEGVLEEDQGVVTEKSQCIRQFVTSVRKAVKCLSYQPILNQSIVKNVLIKEVESHLQILEEDSAVEEMIGEEDHHLHHRAVEAK